MKALTIRPARGQQRASGDILAAVSNLRSRIDARTCLSLATAATVALFISLGAMSAAGIIISGLTALTAAAIAPMGDIDARIEKEGGEL